MTLPLRCRCGTLRGTMDPDRAYSRGTCYCTDCQAYLRFLARTEVLDRCGGTDIVPMSPAGVRITAGAEHLACVMLSEAGILRWYAGCCRTPLANTPRSARVVYAGLVTACLDADASTVDAALGPRDRVVLNASSAICAVKATPLAFFTGGLRIGAGILAGRLRGAPASPFFDADGRRTREPQVLDAAARAALAMPKAHGRDV